jgi:hypothetical protein
MKKTENTIVEQITLTAEELAQLQGLVKDFNSLQAKCGEIEIQKHQLLHKVDEVMQTLDIMQAGLKETYGDVVIDINTGICRPQSDEISS